MGFKARTGTGAAARRLGILRHLQAFLNGVLRLGGKGDLRFDAPLALAEVGELPPGAASFFTTILGRIDFHWSLDDAAADTLVDALGDEFEECRYGGFELHPGSIEAVDIETWSLVDDTWRNKQLFAPVGSGDYLGIDTRDGRVVYLSHELDPDSHGRVLGSDLTDALERWAPLGWVGPEAANWEPFAGAAGIDPQSARARTFIDYVVGAGVGDWQSSKRDKYARLVERARDISLDPATSFDRMIAGFIDGDKPTRASTAAANGVLARIEDWYGVPPRPELNALVHACLTGEFAGEFGSVKARMPKRALTDGANAFAHVATNWVLLAGALSGTFAFGSANPWDTYLIEVSGDSTAVFTTRPSRELKYRAPSIHTFAQLLALDAACANVDWHEWSPDKPPFTAFAAAVAPLMNQLRFQPKQDKNALDRFIATFQNPARRSQHPVLERWRRVSNLRHVLAGDTTRGPLESPPPGAIADLACADALAVLLLGFFTGADPAVQREHVRAASQHGARLVRDAGSVIAAALDGVDHHHPAWYLLGLRRLVQGEPRTLLPVDDNALAAVLADPADETEAHYVAQLNEGDSDGARRVAWLNLAYFYLKAGSFERLLAVSAPLIAAEPSDGWRYRGQALAALGRHAEALEAFDHSLLAPSTSRNSAFAHKAACLRALGNEAAAAAHDVWA